MKCSDARFALAADPSDPGAEVAAHLASCADCVAYARDMRQLDERLLAAMQVAVPAIALPTGPYLATAWPLRRPVLRPLALAASVAGVALLVGMLWVGVPRQSLASAVVEHMAHEPDAWSRAEAMPAAAVAPVLARSDLRLRDGLPGITYANSCWFRGRYVPHLVVQASGGPVTIMVLPHEQLASRVRLEEGGYRGVLVPAGKGSIAVLARDGADVEAVISQTLAAIAYAD